MADNFKNTSCKLENSTRKLKGVRRQGKKKKHIRRKNKIYFKTKRLLRSLAIRKKNFKMNNDTMPSPQSADNRWQHQDEIAFWKARAMSLEYENQMLHKHIKQVYVNMTIQNASTVHFEENNTDIEYESNKKNTGINEDELESNAPTEQISKKRDEELQRLYGTDWRTIIGMETALQLNFDVTVEKNKLKYWPVVPIKM